MHRILKFTLISLLGLLGSAAAQDKPNVVLVITDDQGYGDIGAHGHPFIKTPNLDALHADSVRLNDYHVAPTCAPTRAALYTGHWTNRTGVWHTIMGRSMIRANEVTIADVFAKAGYTTGFFGKWHLGDNFPYRPEDRGFQEVMRHGGGGVGQTPDYWDNAYFDDTYWHNGKPTKTEGHCTDVWFGYGKEFIRAQKAAGKPFLAIIATNAPHGPMHAPQEFADLYKEALPGPEETGGTGEKEDGDKKKKAKGKDPTADRHYFGMISHIDENVGQLRQLLADEGLAENTIFIFTTDNGTVRANHFDGGMRGGKGSEYDGGHRVPFFMHWPAGELKGGRQIETITAYVDILPTLIELCEIPAPEGVKFDGVSIRPLLEKGDHGGWAHRDRILITDSQRVKDPIKWRKSATMTDRWRLINGKELFDINADPKQAKDVAGDHPEVVARLTKGYDAWWEELLPTFSQTTEIYLGVEGTDPVRLTSHDWISEGTSPWHQGHIRGAQDAKNSYGPWAVKVTEAGKYRIELRRWPASADHPIREDLPAQPGVPGQRSQRTYVGKGIPAKEAILNIAGQELRHAVADGDKAISFEVELPEGPAELFGKFIREDGSEIGSFYAYVTKL